MSKKVKIFCPGIQVHNDEVLQIIKPGILNSTLCDYTLTSCIWGRAAENPEWLKKFKENGSFTLGSPSKLPELGSFGKLDEPMVIPYEEDDIDVVLISGSGTPDKFKNIANHYHDIPIINVDYKDVKVEKMWTEITNRDNVFNFKRSMVHTKSKKIQKYPYTVHHAPFCVREDVYAQQQILYRQNYNSRE